MEGYYATARNQASHCEPRRDEASPCDTNKPIIPRQRDLQLLLPRQPLGIHSLDHIIHNAGKATADLWLNS